MLGPGSKVVFHVTVLLVCKAKKQADLVEDGGTAAGSCAGVFTLADLFD